MSDTLTRDAVENVRVAVRLRTTRTVETLAREHATRILEPLWLQPEDLPSLKDAKRIQRGWCVAAHGFAAYNPPLLGKPTQNHKTSLGLPVDAFAYSLAFAPADESGWEVCAWRTPECTAGCVSKAGNGAYKNTTLRCICKTVFLMEHPVR